jgi:hypothetical protein
MNVETPEELAERVADWLGIYGCCDQEKCKDDSTCCRTQFVPDFADRVRDAVHNEAVLQTVELNPHTGQ